MCRLLPGCGIIYVCPCGKVKKYETWIRTDSDFLMTVWKRVHEDGFNLLVIRSLHCPECEEKEVAKGVIQAQL